MKSDYPFPDKCEKCIHNDVCYMVGECLNHLPDFECDCFEEKRPHGEWRDFSDDGYVECPFCEHATTCNDDIEELHFCFFCGASMVKKEGDKNESDLGH